MNHSNSNIQYGLTVIAAFVVRLLQLYSPMAHSIVSGRSVLS